MTLRSKTTVTPVKTRRRPTAGVTFLELLVGITIVGLFAALLRPAIQAADENQQSEATSIGSAESPRSKAACFDKKSRKRWGSASIRRQTLRRIEFSKFADRRETFVDPNNDRSANGASATAMNTPPLSAR
jgi:cytoskeletal protein RodZ